MNTKIVLMLLLFLSFHNLHADYTFADSQPGLLTSMAPEAPSLLSPANGALEVPVTAELSWALLPHTATYRLQVSIQADLKKPVIDRTGLTEIRVTVDLNPNTLYYWRVSGKNRAGNGTYSQVWNLTTTTKTSLDNKNSDGKIPDDLILLPAYPNPFNASTTLSYQLPQAEHVNLSIYDSVGQHVVTLADEQQESGTHTLVWDGREQNGLAAASGVYVYSLKAGDFVQQKKMVVLK